MSYKIAQSMIVLDTRQMMDIMMGVGVRVGTA